MTNYAGKVYADDPAWLKVGGQRGAPGVWCQIEPIGAVPDALPLDMPIGKPR